MVSKPQLQSSTVAVDSCLKGASSFQELATKYDVGVLNSKSANEVLTARAAVTTQKNDDKNKRLCVTFSAKTDVFEISRPTQEEKIEMHMSKEDQKLIIREISTAMRRFDLDESYIGDLGLEKIIEQQDLERTKRIKSAICVILQRQRQSRIFDASKDQIQILNDLWLEKHYRPFSKVSADLARSRGLQDQEKSPYLFPRKIVMSR